MSKARDIAGLPQRWQRRTLTVLYYPLCMILMFILFLFQCVIGIGQALGDMWEGVCIDIAEAWEWYITDTHRYAKRTWNK